MIAVPALADTIVGAAAAYPYLAPVGWSAPYLEQHRQTEGIALKDSIGRWAGALDCSLTTRARDGAVPANPVPYVSLSAEASEAFGKILHGLEDWHIVGWELIHGIDMVGVARGFVSLITGGDGPGGSALTVQLVRSMDGINPGAQSTWVKLQRKAHEFTVGPLLYHRLGGADAPAFQGYLARHITLVMGARGSAMGTPLHGVELTAQVVFDKPASRLTRHEAAMLAAAVQAPIILAPADDAAGVAKRQERCARV